MSGFKGQYTKRHKTSTKCQNILNVLCSVCAWTCVCLLLRGVIRDFRQYIVLSAYLTKRRPLNTRLWDGQYYLAIICRQ